MVADFISLIFPLMTDIVEMYIALA